MKDLLFKDKKETPPKRKDFLTKALHDCQQALDDAYMGLQNTNEPDLIDRYIYELNAAHMRYRVLMREMREIAGTEEAVQTSAPSQDNPYSVPAFFSTEPVPVSANISSTNLDTKTSLLNRSFR